MPTETTGTLVANRAATLALQLDDLCLSVDNDWVSDCLKTLRHVAKTMDDDADLDIRCATDGSGVFFLWGDVQYDTRHYVACGSAILSRWDCRDFESSMSGIIEALADMADQYASLRD